MPDPPDAPPPGITPVDMETPVESDPSSMSPDPAFEPILKQIREMDGPRLHEMQPEEARRFAEIFEQMDPSAVEIARVEDFTIPGPAGQIPVRLYHPEPGKCLPILVSFHGGGWVLGSLDSHDMEARMLAARSHCAVLSIDYRLAPESPFPAAVEDAYAALEWASANASDIDSDSSRLGVSGCSSGGNLAAVCALMARDRGGPAIRHQLLVYPVTDADFDRPTMLAFSEGLLLEREQMIWFWNLYCPNMPDRDDFRACPIRADSFAGLPTTYLLLASMDPLLDEGIDYGTKLVSAGVRTVIRVAPRMIHGFFGMGEKCPAAQAELERACATVHAELHREG